MIDDNEDFFVVIIMNYFKDGDLNNFVLKNYPLSEELILEILLQVCEGLIYLHENKIVHRDLKVSLKTINFKAREYFN